MKALTIIAVLLFAFAANAQPPAASLKYRRSSIYTIMVNDTSRERAEVISKTYLAAPVPDKFNDHNLNNRKITAKSNVKEQDSNIINYLRTNDVAKKLVAKWFNRTEKGTFDMNLVAERGSYNASEMDASLAKKSKRGLALLGDAGEELIGNTFVLVSDFKYVNKEEVAKNIKKGMGGLKLAASFVPGAGSVSTAASVTSTAATVAGKGYVVKTTSYLFRLRWNDSIAAVFYNDYWMDSKSFDLEKKKAFDYSNIFTLDYIGSDVAWADVQSSIFTSKSEDQLVEMATVKTADAVIAKLQRNHEEFRTKTPLFSADPLTAKIGLKEGLESGDKYTVLEQVLDEDGRTRYEKVGLVKVDGSQVWDNRYMATGDSTKPVDCTLFRKISGKDFYPGLLIIQK